MIKKELGLRISTYRRSKRLTQEKLAEMTDYSADFIGLVERGVNAPNVEGCARIADALNISLAELFNIGGPLPDLSKAIEPAGKPVKRPRGRPKMLPDSC